VLRQAVILGYAQGFWSQSQSQLNLIGTVMKRAIVAFGLLILMTGCIDLGTPKFDNPFSRTPPPEYKSQYGLTPTQKVDRLRQLAVDSQSMTADQQRAVTRELITTLSNETNPLLRRELVRTLGGMSVQEAAEGLQIALDDDNHQVRIAACEAWGRRPDAQSVDILASVLSEEDDVDVRLAASQALSRRTDQSAIIHAAATLEDRDPAVQLATMESLRNATGATIGDNISEWKSYLAGTDKSLAAPRSAPILGDNPLSRLVSGEDSSPLVKPPVYEDVSSGQTAADVKSIFR